MIDGAGDGKDRRLIATVEEYDARESSDVWSYTAKVSAAAFYAAVDGDGDYAGDVYAVGLSDKGERSGTSASVATVVVVTEDSNTTTVDDVLTVDDGAARTVSVSGENSPDAEGESITFTAIEGAGQTDDTKGPATRTVTTFTFGDNNTVPDPTGTVSERVDTRSTGVTSWTLGTVRELSGAVTITESEGVVTAEENDNDGDTSDDTYAIDTTSGSESLTTTTYAAGATATEDVAARPALVSVGVSEEVDER